MSCPVSDVGGLDRQASEDFPLHAEIPVLGIRVPAIGVVREQRPRIAEDPLVDARRHAVKEKRSRGIALGKTQIRQPRSKPRRRGDFSSPGRGIEYPVAGPDDGLVAAERPPGQAETRSPILFVRIVGSVRAVEARRVLKLRLLCLRHRPRGIDYLTGSQVEAGDQFVTGSPGLIVVVANAEIQRNPGMDLPVILKVERVEWTI